MDSIHLSAFFRNVTSWPDTEAEFGAVAEKVARLMGASFAAIARDKKAPQGGWTIGWKLEGIAEPLLTDTMREYVRQKLVQAESLFDGVTGGAPVLKQLQVSGERKAWRTQPEISHLAIIRLSAEARLAGTQASGRGTRERLDHGWLLIGSPKAFGAKEEILALAAAQKLASLADAAVLENAIQLRNQFLSIASHELKTPLTSIYGVLQLQERMLRLKKDEPEQVKQERQESYLKMTIRQTQRLNELIDGLLDVSRIQNGRFMAEPSDTDVAALVRETVAGRLAVIAQEAGVRLSAEIPERLRAWVDPVRMEEVVTNLVMNAIRFSPEGGVVWIRVRADEDGALRLTVRDQGPSVPIEDRERIFQPFERAQRTARFGGLGLGLFISRQIAQLHGGTVALIESVPGKGNVFEAIFPSRLGGGGTLSASA